MKTRSLGIAFAALLAFAPVRSNAGQSADPAAANPATPAADPGDSPISVARSPPASKMLKTTPCKEAMPGKRYRRDT